jgi:predicted O-methyltransferase YrrM
MGLAGGVIRRMFGSLLASDPMRALPRIFRRQSDGEGAEESDLSAMQAYSLWGRVSHFAAEIQKSDFMAKMSRQLEGPDGQGLMGALDCATLYGLTRWQRPMIVVESGGYVGMSSAFILKALADEGLTDAKLYSLEQNQDCRHGALVPSELRPQFVPLTGRVEDFIKRDELPSRIDMFLHDSSHRYRHMLWEFREFWGRLRSGGMLVSHDVHFNAAFVDFVAKTHAHNKNGILNARRTTHCEWGRWGYVGFVIKRQPGAGGGMSLAETSKP